MNTYRWIFTLNEERFRMLKLCASKLRALAEDDPQMTLLAPGKAPKSEVVNLDGEGFGKMYGMPKEIKAVRFETRTLIEGLVAHGILRPGDIPALLNSLSRHAVVPAFQDRILESFFKEERIKDVQRLVPGESGHLWTTLR
jgi:RNA-dependent RNA polymerase